MLSDVPLRRLRIVATGAALIAFAAVSGAARPAPASRSHVFAHSTIAFLRWSPDGRSVAFLRRESAGDAVYVAAATGGVRERRAFRVVALGPPHAPFAWSPGGRLLAGTSPRGVAVVDTRTRRLRSRIVALGVLSDWSPRGTSIVFWRPVLGDPVTYEVRANGRRLRRLARGYDAHWSPDGRSLAFVARGRVHVLRPDATGPMQVSPDEREVGGRSVRRNSQYWPIWSPDGRRIAYRERTLSAIEADDETYVVPADATRSSVHVGDGFAQWSPTSRHIAVLGAWRPGVRIAAADGSATAAFPGARGGMDWSPGGETIAFSDGASVYVAGRTGSPVRRLTAGYWPEWSPRGSVIAVARATRCGERVFTVRVRDRAVRPISDC